MRDHEQGRLSLRVANQNLTMRHGDTEKINETVRLGLQTRFLRVSVRPWWRVARIIIAS